MTHRWTTLSGTTIGSVHVRDRLPLQDAVLTWSDPHTGHAVVAVADGHGHRLHFRSDTGAALAVVTAVEELRRTAGSLADLRGDDASAALELARTAGAAVVAGWQEKIRHHLAANPYSAAEEELGAGADPLRAYGTTVLAAVAAGDVVVFVQIGDGDTVVVNGEGVASRPLPEDPDLDGLHTSSLCQPRPLDSLRVAALPVSSEDVALLFLCTDGFSRSRVDAAGWWRQTGEQLLDFARRRGLMWVRDQLPEWLAEPALVGGDDTTMALLVRADVAGISRPDLAETVEVPVTAERPADRSVPPPA
ncbi:protein phosphatase 2C domain-containing protein [Nocardioides sp. zg-ZUI104]|uniref:protein phosphatase 2C domain-containing protein n=1 Tax=Nocardioides faecalis TaxID=2803858 RepID=UPI001BCC98EA|nr:protein phosphatase 2C domain-containing protein [Nocardioides faecalis]MBS4752577.1 protein phosphatase 2C domain-containing protein [Nocardioides faecalis]